MELPPCALFSRFVPSLRYEKKAPYPKVQSLFKHHSHSAGDLTRTEASGAHMHVLGRAVDNRLDALHIGFPGAV